MHPVAEQAGADLEVVEIDAEELERLEQERIDRLTALSMSLRDKRKDAIDARLSMGIDEQWREDLEFYEGIDDANRHEMRGNGAFTSKPPGQIMAGGAGDGQQQGSTVFLNVTRPYCDAAAARIGDMLMPTDDRSFSIIPTPVPEIEDMAKGKMPRALQKPPGASPEAVKSLLQKAMEDAKIVMDEANDRAKMAQTRIDDWLVECQYHAEARRMIDDCAKLGTGVLKGPVPVKRKRQSIKRAEDGSLTLAMGQQIMPGSRRIDPRNLYPDGSCGDNIHNGSYIWERDQISRKQLMDLRDAPGYIASQVEECLKEGPQMAAHPIPDDERRSDPSNKDSFEIWYFHGMIMADDMRVLGCECPDDVDDMAPIHVVLTMVNDRVIKGALNHLDTGEFPYDVMCWQQVSGRWAGIGVSRQIRTPQRVINAAARNLMDNAGLTSGPQILVKLGVVTPADGNYELHGRKVWFVAEDVELSDIKQAFGVFNIEARQQELMEIVNFGLKLAEDVTGLPLILQGQQGQAPDTLGGMQMLNNNASTVTRRIAKGFDDYITEPHIRRYYAWLMQYGDEAEKGDYAIDARGSSALVERDVQNQAVMQMGAIVVNPVFGVNPKKWFAEFCKSQRLDAKTFQYTDEEQKQIDAQASQGPSDPRVAVAQMRGQIEERLKTLDGQFKHQMLMLEQQFEQSENDKDRQFQAWLAQLEQSGTKSITLDQIKARLGDTALKLKTQRDLSVLPGKGPQVSNPPSEPAGRADNGRAYPE